MAAITVTVDACDWPLETSACSDWDDLAPVTGIASTIAANTLYRLSGRRYTSCSTTLRPCFTDTPNLASTYNAGLSPFSPYPGVSLIPVIVDGFPIRNTYACHSCSIRSRSAITLPFPVVSVDAVDIAGTTIDPAQFVVYDSRTIVWQSPDDPPATFPTTQDLNAPAGDPSTWSLTITHGTPPPIDTAYITGIFACELAKMLADLPCALPRTVTNISRQGVTYTMVQNDFIEMGYVGIRTVDEWIHSVNPHRLASPPRVFSPDTISLAPRTQTWP
jgi:hypothetical protein